VDLVATDVPSQSSGSTMVNITPGTLDTFAVIPDATTQTAGAGFGVRLTGLDLYQNVDTNFTGSQCVTFSGPDQAPNGATPQYPTSSDCATGSSPVTFVNGYADGPNSLDITLFDAETTPLTVTLTTGTQTGSHEIVVSASPTVAGIGITEITPNAIPALACGGGVGSIICTSTGESDSGGNELSASIQLEDQFGNATVNTTANPLLIDLQTSGAGSVVPDGTGVLSILNGQSTSSGAFTLTRALGSAQTVTLTASLEDTAPAQTVTVTLSS
jgi:hypothetical protein